VRNWIRALALVFPLSAAFPALASTITGADGLLAPAADYTLPYRADGIFDFSAIDLGAGITLRFDPQTQNVTLLSLGDILIAGVVDAIGIQLALETPGQIVVTGSISAGSISLAGGAVTLTGGSRVSTAGGNLSLSGKSQLVPGRGASVPGADLLLSGAVLLRGGGDISIGVPGDAISPGALRLEGGNISIRGGTISAVPEPATSWLIALLLPALALLGGKRRHGQATLLQPCR
jgi:hypothetical protein